MKLFALTFLIFIFCSVIIQSQVTINIPGDYPTIQQGINAASNGDLVLVADGTYTENINFKGKAITVASHFIQDGNKSHINNTIIDGSSPSNPDSGSVVVFENGEDTSSVICGFTITGGSGTYYSTSDYRLGGGILLFFSGAKICNNIITLNQVDNTITYTRCYGGGILAAYSTTLIIENNIISKNLIENHGAVGGGISLFVTGKTWIISNEISNNVIDCVSGSGGGIDIWTPANNTYVQNNIIRKNKVLTSYYGGGGIDIFDSNSSVFISNNIIAENQGFQGGAILVENSTEDSYQGMNNFKINSHAWDKNNNLDYSNPPENISLLEAVIENNTIVNNIATSYCSGIYCINTSPEIRNSIIWGNQPQPQIVGAGFVEYSDVEGGYTGTGNIDIDPQFVNSQYYLLTYPTSPCIDAGHPDTLCNDVENPVNPGYALFPAMETTRNDMGTFGGPHSTWSSIILDTLRVPIDYATIQEAIDAAMNGNVVLVDEGTYYENINFRGKAITVASHFLVDGNESHIENTIIDGSQPTDPDSASVVTFRNGEDTNSVVCGFTITGGKGTRILINGYLKRVGGGVFAHTSDAKIQNNIIESNSIQNNSDSWGGGICCFDGDYVIENNTIKDNEINSPVINFYSLGGGIYTYSLGYVRIANNKILDNIITAPEAWGGGIIPAGQDNDNYFILNNLISGNTLNVTTGGSGGIDLYGHSPTVINNVIVNNSAPKGGGAVIENSMPVFSNNTIAYNTSTVRGGGVDITGSNPLMMNCIFWGNTAPSSPQIFGLATVVYSDVEGGYAGLNNIDLNPEFEDTLNLDFQLKNISPCIGAGIDSLEIGGTWYYCPPFCYNGNPRPNPSGSVPDIGACESPLPNPVGVDDDISFIPNEFALSQNYPNPFNPATTIKFGLPERSFVELRVYDILGREITTLVNEELDSGYYETNFNAVNLSSGIYVYQIKAGDFVNTKKMILMK